MAIGALTNAFSGMQANAVRQAVSANNIANANTDGFRASTVAVTDAPYLNDIGQGARTAGTYAPPRPGPAIATAQGGVTEGSNTDLVTEMTRQLAADKAYGFNVTAARTTDDMLGALLDLKS